jgi:hypothetical protein
MRRYRGSAALFGRSVRGGPAQDIRQLGGIWQSGTLGLQVNHAAPGMSRESRVFGLRVVWGVGCWTHSWARQCGCGAGIRVVSAFGALRDGLPALGASAFACIGAPLGGCASRLGANSLTSLGLGASVSLFVDFATPPSSLRLVLERPDGSGPLLRLGARVGRCALRASDGRRGVVCSSGGRCGHSGRVGVSTRGAHSASWRGLAGSSAVLGARCLAVGDFGIHAAVSAQLGQFGLHVGAQGATRPMRVGISAVSAVLRYRHPGIRQSALTAFSCTRRCCAQGGVFVAVLGCWYVVPSDTAALSGTRS